MAPEYGTPADSRGRIEELRFQVQGDVAPLR